MFETMIVTGYWLITCSVIAYLGYRELFLLKRLSAWTLPANVNDHSGLRVPDGTSIFASPGDIGARLLSVEAVAVSEPDNIVPIRLMIGAAYGAAWGAAGLWVSAVETGFSLWLLIVVNSAVMAFANQRGVKDAFITYVSEEGFGLVTIRCDGNIKYFLPHMTRRHCYLFDELESATSVGNVIMCIQRRSGDLLTLRRPLPFPPDEWRRWFQSWRHSLEDIGYSTSLSKVARITKKTDPMGLRNIVVSDLGVTFEIHSVLGGQRHTDQVAPRLPIGGQPRRPVGRLAFCETGFVFEDWIPLYASLRKLNLYSEGLEFMFWKIETLGRGTETRKVIDEWREKHVVSLPINVIDSITAEPDRLSISTIDRRRFNFFGDQIAGYAVLMRLIRSSIWSQGIKAELVAQIELDLKQLCEAGNAADLTGVVFGDRLPKHRASIWYAAFRFELHPRVGSELELQLRDQVFHDCFRVMQVQSSFEIDTMQRFLDSSRTIHCLSQPATSTGVASTPEIVVDATSVTRPS